MTHPANRRWRPPMPPSPSTQKPRSRVAVPARLKSLALLLPLLMAALGTPAHAAPPARSDNLYKRQGYWEPARPWFGNIITASAALLRGDTTHSQLLGWADHPTEVWQWNVGDTLKPVA